MYHSEMFHLVFFFIILSILDGLEVAGNLKITNALFSHVSTMADNKFRPANF
jgi:hypothetical protein